MFAAVSVFAASPLGAITGMSRSPRDMKVIWAGTDDGNVQVTRDGGGESADVAPTDRQVADVDAAIVIPN